MGPGCAGLAFVDWLDAAGLSFEHAASGAGRAGIRGHTAGLRQWGGLNVEDAA